MAAAGGCCVSGSYWDIAQTNDIENEDFTYHQASVDLEHVKKLQM